MITKKYAAGLDIGGTKCAAVLGELGEQNTIRICGKKKIATAEAVALKVNLNLQARK